MKRVVVVSAVRTPIGSCGGQFSHIPAASLGGIVLNQAVRQAEIDPGMVDDVVMGHSCQGHTGLNSARTALIEAGWPGTVPGVTLDRRCCSGLDAVCMGVMKVQTGNADIVVAGGMESMSQAGPLAYDDTPAALMLAGVEAAAKAMGISRQEADRWALGSHQKATNAIDRGAFAEEIVPVPSGSGRPADRQVLVDEPPDRTLTLARLAACSPLRTGGICTCMNGATGNDGAAAVVLMSEEKAHKLGIIPLAYFRSCAVAAMSPKQADPAVARAATKALKLANLRIEEIDLFEVQELYAAQTLVDIGHLGISEEAVAQQVNVNGSGIALGHPLAATGTMRLVSLLQEMKRRRAGYGLETVCGAGGQGVCTIFEGYNL